MTSVATPSQAAGTERFATGLVAGRFAPLHRGHEALIRHAQQVCDHVVIISYANPEIPECEPGRRAQWLKELFPGATRLVLSQQTTGTLPANTAPDEIHGNFVAEVCIHTLKRRVDAVFTSDSHGPGLAALLTGKFQTAGLGSAAVLHVAVDPSRIQIPITASQVREDPWLCWTLLPPAVSRTLVHRIALLGADSSGKSSLAQSLAQEFQTKCAEDYGRELLAARHGAVDPGDMRGIAAEQIRRENHAVQSARRYVFCDSTPLTTLYCSEHLFGRSSPELQRAAGRTYDLTILCEPDFDFVPDGSDQKPELIEAQLWYAAQLQARGISYLSVRGPLTERVTAICEHLRANTFGSGRIALTGWC